MRVFMLISQFHPFVGGAERQCLKLSRELAAQGVEVEVITEKMSPEHPRHEAVEGIPATRLTRIRPVEIATILTAGYLISRRRDWDVLHCHILGPLSLAAWIASKVCGKPYLIKLANSGPRFDLRVAREVWRLPMYAGIRSALLQADRVAAICEAVHGDLLEQGVTPSRIAFIPNGVEPCPPSDEALRLRRRRELGLPEDALVVLRVGTLMEKKGVGFLLDAWPEVLRRHPSAFLLSLGGDILPPSLAAKAGGLFSVRFDPVRPDGVLPYLQAADLFVLPSLAEGLSNALLEAQAAGLPCVATRVGGAEDVIREGENGLLVPPADAQALVEALDAVLASEPARRALGRGARERSQEFDIRETARRYVELYGELTGIPAG